MPGSRIMQLLAAKARSGQPAVQSCAQRLLWHCYQVSRLRMQCQQSGPAPCHELCWAILLVLVLLLLLQEPLANGTPSWHLRSQARRCCFGVCGPPRSVNAAPQVVFKQLESWLVHGLLLDSAGEFFIQPSAALGEASEAQLRQASPSPLRPAFGTGLSPPQDWDPLEWHSGFEASD